MFSGCANQVSSAASSVRLGASWWRRCFLWQINATIACWQKLFTQRDQGLMAMFIISMYSRGEYIQKEKEQGSLTGF